MRQFVTKNSTDGTKINCIGEGDIKERWTQDAAREKKLIHVW